MKYFMLRVMNHADGFGRKLFENDYISIGYRAFDKQNNLNFIEIYKNTQNKEVILKENIYKAWKGETIGSHWKLDKFFNFSPEDILLIPDYGCFYLVRVVSEVMSFESIKNEFCLNNEEPDIGFVYKIEKICSEGIPRKSFANSKLTARLKSFLGLLDITDLKEDIDQAKKFFLENKPININECIKTHLKNEILKQLKINLDPNKFEVFLTKLLYKLGATTVTIPAKNNKNNALNNIGDVDVVAIFEKLKHIIYIQAKFHNEVSGKWALEQLNDYKDSDKEEEGYTQAFWAITTADTFSQDAIDFSNSEKTKNIRLMTGLELAELILDVGIEGFQDY